MAGPKNADLQHQQTFPRLKFWGGGLTRIMPHFAAAALANLLL